jgi:hypothetical protein
MVATAFSEPGIIGGNWEYNVLGQGVGIAQNPGSIRPGQVDRVRRETHGTMEEVGQKVA